MTITIEGLHHDRSLRTLILRRVTTLAQRVRPTPVRVRIAFSDENGPKGGNDTRCAVTIEVPRQPSLHVEDLADSQRLAFDSAFAGVERLVQRTRQALRARRRRPKKYYLAKRLLEGDPVRPSATG